MNRLGNNDLGNLAAWLQQHAPNNILMPLIAKRPMEPHRGGQWTWEDFYNYPALSSISDFGILMKDLFCVDFDNLELFEYFRGQHPEWFEDGSYALARTSKGYHVICKRPPLCDEIQLYDKSRSLEPGCVPAEYLDVHGEVPIDMKTISSTGTAGVLVVSPSQGKEWIISPWSLVGEDGACKMKSLSEGFLQWLVDNQKRRTLERISKQKDGTVCDPKIEGAWACGIDEGIALAKAKQLVELGNVVECRSDPSLLLLGGDPDARFYRRDGSIFYFLTGPRRECPYRKDPHNHNNFAIIYCKNGDILYWCFGSPCQDVYKKRKEDRSLGSIVIDKWYHKSLMLILDEDMDLDLEFDEEKCKVWTDEWDELMAVKPAKRNVDRLAEVKEQLMNYYNRFFVVVKSSKPSILELTYDKNDRVQYIERRNVRNTFELYKARFFRDVWFASGKRRHVKRLVYEIDPKKVGPRDFNLFTGLKIENEYKQELEQVQLDESKIAQVLELVHDVWAAGDRAVSDYILNWLAYPLQKRAKTGVCLVVISEQGFGKGTIGEELMGNQIYGASDANENGLAAFARIDDIDDLVGKFNSMACMRVFINADECGSYGGAWKQAGKFKTLVTTHTRRLEHKGVDAISVKDFSNILMTTNSDNPVRVELSDRRFVILRIPADKKKSSAFFKQLHASINKGGVDGTPFHFYKFLMARDLRNFSPQDDRPITTAARDMMTDNIPPIACFVQWCVETQKIDLGFVQEFGWKEGATVSTRDLFQAYKHWVVVTDRKGSELNYDSFCIKLPKIVSWKKAQVTSGENKGHKGYELPSLQAAEECLRTTKYWQDR